MDVGTYGALQMNHTSLSLSLSLFVSVSLSLSLCVSVSLYFCVSGTLAHTRHIKEMRGEALLYCCCDGMPPVVQMYVLVPV